ncbi:MAG: YbaY family lipoprotein [Steroidobacteraceae bacterium]|nr:YbaY family lipoprotein [Steroidobacteraceae bacterium]
MSNPKSFPRGLLSLVLFLAGCTSAPVVPESGTGTATSKVTGSITYRERIALPPSAVVIVKLVDVSLADAPAVLIAEQAIATAGRQVPFEFALAYDASRIQPSHTYAVQVRIEDGGKLLFISDTVNRVITRDAPIHVDIVVRKI